jgi:hypothetical protein
MHPLTAPSKHLPSFPYSSLFTPTSTHPYLFSPGPDFRKLTPAQVDAIIPTLQVHTRTYTHTCGYKRCCDTLRSPMRAQCCPVLFYAALWCAVLSYCHSPCCDEPARFLPLLTHNTPTHPNPLFHLTPPLISLTPPDPPTRPPQVLARSSPDDKHLLVTRLNGHALPDGRTEWEALHPGYAWEIDRDRLLPGIR